MRTQTELTTHHSASAVTFFSPMPKAVHVEEAKSGNAFKKFVNKCRTSGENLFRKVHPTKVCVQAQP